MDVTGVWEVDRLAAADLLIVLKTVPQAEWPEVIATAFSKARLENYDWAAKRVRETVIDILETEAVQEFRRKDMIWTDGFRHAEECIVAQMPTELLRVYSGQSKSKGQVLRSLVRSARQQPYVPSAEDLSSKASA